MQYVQAMPTFITVLALSYMGFLVVRNSRDLLNRFFLSFVAVDAIWLLTVYFIISNSFGPNIYLGRVVFGAAVAVLITAQLFLSALLGLKHTSIYRVLMYGAGATLFAATIFTPLIIKGVGLETSATDLEVPFPVYGPLYPLFVAYIVLGALSFFFVLFRRARSLRDTTAKRQINVIAIGLMLFAGISLLTNLILPALLSDHWPSLFVPLGSLALASSFFYAMRRYGFFDIKVTVVRSTTYIFLIVGLGLLYGVGIRAAGSLITVFHGSPGLQEIFNIVVVLAIAASFHPLRKAFDRLTNRFFFRDMYDTQDVVDKLNRILISNTDIRQMLLLCENLLVDKLKLEFVTFGLFVPGRKPRIMGSLKDEISITDYIAAGRAVFKLEEKVLVSSMGVHGAVRKLFEKKNVSAVGKMTLHDDGIGFIVFGNKKNDKPLSRQDIGLLGIASDQIAIATQNVLRFEEIARFNTTLQERVDEKTHKLQLTNDKLRRLDQTKDDFISMASHQLRTPLTSIKGYISMVLEGDAGEVSPLQKKLLSQAFVSSQRMVYLISDLLNVSRLRTGKFVIEPTPTHLATIAREEVSQLQETAKSRGIELSVTHTDHFPALLLDETKMRQVIMNFIDNAIYYTPEGGHISVNVVEKPQSVELTVVDDGMGVPKSDQPHLFTKFFRANNAKRARPDGTGLGLFMAKKVVMAQGGAIIFKSQEGKGSTFGFTFAKDKVTVVPHYKPGKKEPSSLLHKPKSAIMS